MLDRGVPVYAAEGTQVGTVDHVVAAPSQDIFHGIVLRRSPDGEKVELPARRIKKMTSRRVITDLGTGDVGSLPPYRAR